MFHVKPKEQNDLRDIDWVLIMFAVILSMETFYIQFLSLLNNKLNKDWM